ncbi:MAG: hypothetical protein J6Q79_06000, partial [Clostridia bacterium]|nr:hypothetical protein [Clostridia bacterium]
NAEFRIEVVSRADIVTPLSLRDISPFRGDKIKCTVSTLYKESSNNLKSYKKSKITALTVRL